MANFYVDTDGVSQLYASLAAALAAQPATFTEDNYILCDASTDVDDTTTIAAVSWNTTADYRLFIVCTSAYRFAPANADRWLFGNTSTTNYMNVTVSGARFFKPSMTANTQQIVHVASVRFGQLRLIDCDFDTVNSGTTYRDRLLELNVSPLYAFSVVVANCRFRSGGTSTSLSNGAIYFLQSTKCFIYFNTFICPVCAISGAANNPDALFLNNIIKSTAASTITYSASSNYNMFSGAFTFGGANDAQGQTFTFVDEAGKDYHLASGDTGAQNLGLDLSTDANYPVTTDADDVTRSDPPDCGAYEVAIDNTVTLSTCSVVASLGALTAEQADNSVSFSACSVVAVLAALVIAQASPTIVIDHTAVAKYADIPASYKTAIKQKGFHIPGESHSGGYTAGLQFLEDLDASFAVNITESGTPEAPTNAYLRANRAAWGDWDTPTGWMFAATGEEDWYTNAEALAQIKTFISYANSGGFGMSALGFGWCWDMTWINGATETKDPVYKCGWAGSSVAGPEGNLQWGLDAEDTAITGNSVCLDTYLAATREYIAYCEANSISTKVFFTTGPIDGGGNVGERGFQRSLKNQRIRDDVDTNGGIIFDYADIESYDNAGNQNTVSWTDGDGGVHTFEYIAADNMLNFDGSDGTGNAYHIGERGALRLGKAIWVMLATIDGWDGLPEANAVTLSSCSVIASPAPLGVEQQIVTFSIESVLASGSGLVVDQQIVEFSPLSVSAVAAPLSVEQVGPQPVSLTSVSVLASPASPTVDQQIIVLSTGSAVVGANALIVAQEGPAAVVLSVGFVPVSTGALTIQQGNGIVLYGNRVQPVATGGVLIGGWFGAQDVEIWRNVPPSGTWGDGEYVYHHTARDVTVQPFSSNQLVRNNQMFSNVIGVLVCDIDEDIIDGDELVYCKNGSYGRVQVVEMWDSDILPHREVYVTYAQWDHQ